MLRYEVLAEAGVPALFLRGGLLEVAEFWVNGRTTFWFSGERLDQIGVHYTLKYPSNGAIRYDANFPEVGALVDDVKELASRIGVAVVHRPGDRFLYREEDSGGYRA